MKEFSLHQDFHASLNQRRAYPSQNQTGFSLIEVLIAAFILSIGILGIVGLQAMSVKGTHQSYMRHQATHLVQNLSEKMRANIDATTASDYIIDSDSIDCATAVTDCATNTATCSAKQLADYDINRLVCGYKSSAGLTGGIRSILASGKLEITCQTELVGAVNVPQCNQGLINIKLSWLERALDEATDGSITPDFIQIDTRIAE